MKDLLEGLGIIAGCLVFVSGIIVWRKQIQMWIIAWLAMPAHPWQEPMPVRPNRQ